ncbi:MAG TPA: hypothetical protein VFH80_34450, partial [Solirubrobacteraceae bacterium]|nr:hypothetical protein [Solirubrobacteraceae bacterium]
MQAFRKLRRLPLTFLALGLALSAAACGSATSSSSTQTSKSPSMPGMSSSTTMSSATGMAQKTAPVSCAAPSAGSQTAMTASRVFTLSLGPAETMYSRQQVRRTHPKVGEVMLSGRMQGAGMSGMSSGSAMPGMAAMKHLEVHICTRNGRKVVTGP